MSPLVAAASLLLAASAGPGVKVRGVYPLARIAGEGASYLVLEPGRVMYFDATGPARVVAELRLFRPAGGKVPARAVVAVRVDGQIVFFRPILGSADRLVDGGLGNASDATLVEAPVEAGAHRLEIKLLKDGAPLLVSVSMLQPEPKLALLPAKPDEDGPASHLAERGDTVSSPAPIAPTAHTSPWKAVRVAALAGGATHLQLGGLAPMVGLSGEWGLGPGRRLGVGLSIDYVQHALALAADLPAPEGGAVLRGSAWALPVMASATYRPLDGAVSPLVGAGAGLAFSHLAIDGLGGRTAILPAGALLAGMAVAAGPGQVLIVGRLLAAGGEFKGVAEQFQVGGASAQAGYRLAL